MQKPDHPCDRLIQDFADREMEKIFYFCLKKTGCSDEAENLTQEIALQVITALNKGTVPANFPAWMWQIARNRYAVWATEKHRRSEAVIASDIGDCELPDTGEHMLEELIHSEQLALLRRELSFIQSDYRNLLVAYYMENRSVGDIASSLTLSETAVKQRLHRARILLKEGMNMAKTFGIRSYKPDEITFVKDGRDGKKGQPWTIVTHLLYKNIFLETYRNPETAEELALELGIALPYMEEELEFLVREQLLRKEGNRYQTDFPIISKEEQRAIFEQNRKIQKQLTDRLCNLIDDYIQQDGVKVNCRNIGYEAAKWALLVHAFDLLKKEAGKPAGNNGYSYPERPDQGAWTLTGYETVDWEQPRFVGLHSYRSYDSHDVQKEIDFAQFKFFLHDLQAKTPECLTWKEAYTLWLVCTGKAEECGGQEREALLKYGYLEESNGTVLPKLVMFDRTAASACPTAVTAEQSAMKEEIRKLFRQAPKIERGYAVEQALKDGWLRYDKTTPNTVGAYIYL